MINPAGLIIVSLAIAAISTTVTLTSLFRPLRVSVKDVPFFGKLLKCPYCLNHWLALPVIFTAPSIGVGIIAAFAVVAMASIFGHQLLKYLDLLES